MARPKIGHELMDIPFGQLVANVGVGIATAQWALDLNSIRVAQIMSGSPWIEEKADGTLVPHEGFVAHFGGRKLSLLELGFMPTFYQFSETTISVKITINFKEELENKTEDKRDFRVDVGIKGKVNLFLASAEVDTKMMYASSHNETKSAKYSYSAEGTSEVKTRLVPVPPPSSLLDRVDTMVGERKERKLLLSPEVVMLEPAEQSEDVSASFQAGESTDNAEAQIEWELVFHDQKLNVEGAKPPITLKSGTGTPPKVVGRSVTLERAEDAAPFKGEVIAFLKATYAKKENNKVVGKVLSEELTVLVKAKIEAPAPTTQTGP